MSVLNTLLGRLGLVLTRTSRPPRKFIASYRRNLSELQRNPGGFDIAQWMLYEAGSHPESFQDHECQFAARWIARERPQRLLDIGSYRWFVLGLLAGHEVTTLDVRERFPALPSETVATGDAKRLDLPDGTFDMVTCLCAIEHFGLGRYGDAFDPAADGKAMAEMSRVLRPGGCLVFSTSVTRGRPTIVFNAHRIYTTAMLERLCSGLAPEEVSFYSLRLGRPCSHDDVTTEPTKFDIYMGCWRKKALRP